MKKMKDVLLAREENEEIVIGNTALVRAMVEAGTRVVTSYPGSPTPEIAEDIRSMPREDRPFYFEFSTNEKVAAEVAFGASVNGSLSTVFFKSVGLNVAADSFVQLGLMELIGGMVIVLGDDPGANSSQNEQDNLHYSKLSYTPVLEPSTPQEVYEMYQEAAEISRQEKMPIILRLTTHVCHAKEKVAFGSWNPVEFDDRPQFAPENGPYVPITDKVFPMKRRALQKREKIRNMVRERNLNKVEDNNNDRRGIITGGVPHQSLLDILEQVEGKRPDILKLGAVQPLNHKDIIEFLQEHKEVKILEELDAVLEEEIKSLAFDEGISTEIIGKQGIEDWMGEYTPDKVAKVLHRTWPDLIPDRLVEVQKERESPLEPRPPQMCPGCGHRSAFHPIKKALREKDITVADIGCHTLGFLPPYNMGEVLLCMGHSPGTGSGMSLYNDERRVVAFIGDSTLYHAGMPGIVNAVFNDHDLTLVVMENNTTAMTGHQNNPSSGGNFNEPTEAIPIKELLAGMGVDDISKIDTYNQQGLQELIEEKVDEEGFNVVIASHPCMLKFTREQRRKGDYRDRNVRIDQEKCAQIYECVQDFACPTFQKEEDGTIWAHEDLCIGDGSCLQTCPTRAIEFVREETGGDGDE
ncbi:thiamine pyrophosphate-dependent enzyme [Halarsenatibacter silvermanii]|uniref:Indolepyruvate oxidoreductase subunit IorA n=1 Tax=Halarsenatibacter silvermanii TaxID=321763 RepID=A0A1G9S1S9_9FIRM|nr:thiamine pyrophosphate-dependent enzyme [Halarsenatibacter silvermanii]SDM29372.1 indolepyruvate ferredoxin oxidoreductase alpha subunit [Halarsenatibacter silvermanii]